MPISRIAIFSGLSAKQKKSQSKFTECTRTCRKDAPQKGSYGPCLRTCLAPGKKSRARRRKK